MGFRPLPSRPKHPTPTVLVSPLQNTSNIRSEAAQIAARDGNVWYTIYHHLPIVKGVPSNPSINQWEFGTSMTSLNESSQDAMGLPSDFRTHTVPGETPVSGEAPW